jgi:hypothetical protein
MQRPQNVSLAIHLQWVVLAMSAVISVLDPRGLVHNSPAPLGTMCLIVVKLCVMFFLAYRLSIGKSRVRRTLLIIFLLGTLPQLYYLTAILRASFVAGVVVIFQATLQAIILPLVFTPSASEWFKSKQEKAFDHARNDRLSGG